FSIDGCKTNLATFNSTGSGDRDDWASSPTSTDIQGAFLFPGVQYSISSADITALDVIGWGAKQTGGFTLSLPQFGSIARPVAPVPGALDTPAAGHWRTGDIAGQASPLAPRGGSGYRLTA